MAPVVRIVALVATGIFAGILFGDWAGASRVRPTLPAGCFIQFQQGLRTHFVRLMPVLIITSILANALAAWLTRGSSRMAAACFGIGALAIVAVLIMTRAVNVPINETLMTWKPDSPPSDLWQTWERWERIHTIRTVIAVLTFVLLSIGISLPSWQSTAGQVR